MADNGIVSFQPKLYKQLQENSIVTRLVLLKYNVNIDSTFPERQFFLERVYKKERKFYYHHHHHHPFEPIM